MKSRSLIAGLTAAGLFVGLGLALSSPEVTAADHNEAPLTAGDPTADILDFYAWHKDDGSIVAIITYAAFIEKQIGEPIYDDEVVYGIHVDNNGDNMPDETAWIQFAQNEGGQWYVQFSGLAGIGGPVVAPVNTATTIGPGDEQAWAGLADDPFFFDLTGYSDTLMSGTISFTGADAFAGFNVMAIVVELSQDAAAGGSNNIQMWAATYR